MLKELLSDFVKVLKPSYQSESFQPYFSMILTIMTLTFLAYGFQTAAINIYTYANNPSESTNKVLQTKFCGDLSKTSLLYICRGVQSNNGKYYKLTSLVSLEQDLHKPIN